MKKRFLSVLFAMLMSLVTVMMVATPALGNGAVNLIVNDDFEAGNSGFTSDYDVVVATGHNTLQPPYVYAIGTDPYLYHSAWTSFGDHTSGTGNMMIVNGSSEGTPGALVWGQTVDTLTCVPVPNISEYTLWAGQSWDIGQVLVKNEAGKICVKFVLTDADAIAEGWLITEAHVAVAADAAGIPQTQPNKKNIGGGNPIPGAFPVNVSFDPGVTETEWFCIDYNWTAGTPVVVAAHASIELAELGHMEQYEFCAVSGTGTQVGDGYADIPDVNPWGGTWNSVNSITGCDDLANRIWDETVAIPFYADNGGMVNFVQSFDITGTPTAAIFKIAADNSFAYSFNSGAPTTENLAAGWEAFAALGDFGYPYMVIDPLSSGWSQVYTYDVLGALQAGSNTLNVTGVNADWDTTSWSVNPAAVIYKLCGTSEAYVIDRPYDDESAWGGECDFYGANWAKYICYTPEEPECDYGSYLLEFYGASSYTAAPAELRVSINGDDLGTLNLTTTPGEWVKFSAVWTPGPGVTTAAIEIRDFRNTFSGDDFCLDDISFVKQ
jgi:hypothetical protein